MGCEKANAGEQNEKDVALNDLKTLIQPGSQMSTASR